MLSTRSASLSSYRASREQEQIESEISSVKETISKLDKEVERFDSKMVNVSKREVERMELEEKIKANAGKRLDYFILPSVARRDPVKKNDDLA